jgi:hypothetical protein
MAADLAPLLAEPLPDAAENSVLLEFGAVFSNLADWLPMFLSALRDDGVEDYREWRRTRAAIVEFNEISAVVSEATAVRPLITPLNISRRIIAAGRSAIAQYVAALAANTPAAAQSAAAGAQAQIDKMAELAGELNSWQERAERLGEAGDVASILHSLLQDGMEQSGADGLIDLDSNFRSQLNVLLGLDVSPGVGVLYAVHSSIAGIYFERDHYDALLNGFVNLFLLNDGVLVNLLHNERFRSDFRAAELEVFDSAIACQNALNSGTIVRQIARAVVEMHGSMVESVGRVLCSALLLAVGRKSAAYEKLRHGNATELLSAAQSDARIGPLLLGLDSHLRTAQAHRGITYRTDELATDLKSGHRVYLYSDLVDRTYLGIESTLAALMAIYICADHLGVDVSESSRLSQLGVSIEDMTQLMLLSFGHPCEDVDVDGGTLVIQLGASDANHLSPALGAIVAQLVDVEVTEFAIRLNSGRELRCPVEPYRNFSNAVDEFGKQAALIEIQAAWHDDSGSQLFTVAHLRNWIAAQVAENHELELAEQIRRLRVLRGVAKEFGDDAAVTALTAVMRMTRIKAAGGVPPATDIETFSLFLEWLGTEDEPTLI